MRLLVLLGCALLGVVGLLGRHANRLDDRLRELQIREYVLRKWEGWPADAYQPAGRSILRKLRWTLWMLLVIAVSAVVILMYARPKV